MAQEILLPTSNASAVANYGNRNTTQTTVVGQNLVPSGSPLVDSALGENNYSLTPGSYSSYFQKGAATIVGVPGSSFVNANLMAPTSINNVTYTGTVTLQSTAVAILEGCRIGSVKCVAGSKARFIGCRFNGGVDNTGGNPVDVILIGCLGASPIVNCTIIG